MGTHGLDGMAFAICSQKYHETTTRGSPDAFARRTAACLMRRSIFRHIAAEMQITDDFLEEADHQRILQVILSPDFTWHLCREVVSDQICDNRAAWQMFHYFFDGPFKSDTSGLVLLQPLFIKLGCKVLVRVKINLNACTADLQVHGFHKDLDYDLPGAKSAVYYLNTNDGCTVFRETRVQSIANRMVTFDAGVTHSGTTCTDQKFRLVLNIVYL